MAASIYNIVNKWLERMKADNFRGALSCLLTIRCLIFIIQFSARMVLTTIIFILFLWMEKYRQNILYLFDYGDMWHFQVELEEIRTEGIKPGNPMIIESKGKSLKTNLPTHPAISRYPRRCSIRSRNIVQHSQVRDTIS